MIEPYEHFAEIAKAGKATTDELMELTKQCQTALIKAYAPKGFRAVKVGKYRIRGAHFADYRSARRSSQQSAFRGCCTFSRQSDHFKNCSASNKVTDLFPRIFFRSQ